MKGPAGKSVDGVYCNPRFIHTAASLVGSVVHIQVKNGNMYEGVFHTFSQKVDIVLEMVVRVDKISSNMATLLSNRLDKNVVTEKMIFKISDVVVLSALNVDLEYATRESFTDTGISRYNGQIPERVLEPWDGDLSSSDSLTDLGADEATNGWAADEMFHTNETKYGVKSSFDNKMKEYTIALDKKDTEEYCMKEAKANKIAQAIESSSHYKNRCALENGDEEDRFSAVVRTDSNIPSNNNRYLPHRGKKPQGIRPARSSPSPNAHPPPPPTRVPHMPQQNYHKPPSSQQPLIKVSAKPVGISPPIPRPMPMRQAPPPMTPPSPSGSSGPVSSHSSSVSNSNSPPSINSSLKLDENEMNGVTPCVVKEPCNKEIISAEALQMPKETDRPKEMREKKVFDDKAEDLKRFHEKFKLSDNKEAKEVKDAPGRSSKNSGVSSSPNRMQVKIKDNVSADDNDEEENGVGEESDVEGSGKNFNLNPNAKEFVLNPNAKTFTPRGLPMTSGMIPIPVAPPSMHPSPRLHAQSPVIALPQAHLMPAISPAMYNVATAAPHYVLPATPVSVPIAPPYTPATSLSQAPRFRKAVPLTLSRNDSSQSIHVQAATGQPILAPSALSAFQYTQSPGILHAAGPPQPQLPYTQMYSMVGQRVITPQALGMVSATGAAAAATAYGDSPHLPTQIYMNPSAMAHASQSGNAGQHSTPSTPQSQTPNLHPAPSPVHQAPPAQTPTGHPSNPPTPQVMYHSQLATQHPLHINPASTNHSHPFPAMYSAGPQPIMLLPHQPMPGPHHPGTFSTLQNPFHGQTPGGHGGTPTAAQIIPHPSVAMMQTSTAIAHAQVSVSNNHHYAPHSQV